MCFLSRVNILCRHIRHVITKMNLFVKMHILSTTTCQCDCLTFSWLDENVGNLTQSTFFNHAVYPFVGNACPVPFLSYSMFLIWDVLEGVMHVTKFITIDILGKVAFPLQHCNILTFPTNNSFFLLIVLLFCEGWWTSPHSSQSKTPLNYLLT